MTLNDYVLSLSDDSKRQFTFTTTNGQSFDVHKLWSRDASLESILSVENLPNLSNKLVSECKPVQTSEQSDLDSL